MADVPVTPVGSLNPAPAEGHPDARALQHHGASGSHSLAVVVRTLVQGVAAQQPAAVAGESVGVALQVLLQGHSLTVIAPKSYPVGTILDGILRFHGVSQLEPPSQGFHGTPSGFMLQVDHQFAPGAHLPPEPRGMASPALVEQLGLWQGEASRLGGARGVAGHAGDVSGAERASRGGVGAEVGGHGGVRGGEAGLRGDAGSVGEGLARAGQLLLRGAGLPLSEALIRGMATALGGAVHDSVRVAQLREGIAGLSVPAELEGLRGEIVRLLQGSVLRDASGLTHLDGGALGKALQGIMRLVVEQDPTLRELRGLLSSWPQGDAAATAGDRRFGEQGAADKADLQRIEQESAHPLWKGLGARAREQGERVLRLFYQERLQQDPLIQQLGSLMRDLHERLEGWNALRLLEWSSGSSELHVGSGSWSRSPEELLEARWRVRDERREGGNGLGFELEMTSALLGGVRVVGRLEVDGLNLELSAEREQTRRRVSKHVGELVEALGAKGYETEARVGRWQERVDVARGLPTTESGHREQDPDEGEDHGGLDVRA